MFVDVVPLEYVKLKGAVPVNVKVTFGSGAPPHTGPPPVIVAVGKGLTTTAAVPPRLVALHPLASVNAVTEYVPAGGLVSVKVVLL